MTEPTEFAVVATSFEDLYLREYPGLIAVATALSGRDGEDLVQDAMVRALVSWEKVRRLERPGGWCHRVLVNLCRSRWRRLVTEARFLSRLRREEPSTPAPSDDVMAFWSAIRELPERPRLAVALFYAGDRSVADVAGILDVPEGTVRSDLSRARSFVINRMEAQS
jgi:RNA polymerase sigma-70 factor (ECF subfamily)